MKEKKGGIFLTKLWSMLQDESIADTVCWDPSGASFHVLNQHKFCEEVLPRFFIHKNMSSFVRQLNQYGFRKILCVDQSSDNNINSAERTQYHNSLFRRGHPELIHEIQRQPTLQSNTRKRNTRIAAMKHIGQSAQNDLASLPQSELNRISESLDSFRQNFLQLQNKVYNLTRKNELLSNEVRLLREQHLKQQQNMERIVQLLMSQRPLPSVQQYGPGNQAESDSLAPHSHLQHNQNLDMLQAIEHNIRSETVHYSSISAFSLPTLQKMEQHTPVEELDMQKCIRPEVIQFTNNVGFNVDQNGSNLEACSSSALILSSIINHEERLQGFYPSDVDCPIAKVAV